MLLNLILLGALFVSAQKKKLKPYHIGLIFGGVKMLRWPRDVQAA